MDKQELLAKIKSTRGYVLPMHEMLAQYHPDYLDKYDDWFNSVMNENSPLLRKVREFVMIAIHLSTNSA